MQGRRDPPHLHRRHRVLLPVSLRRVPRLDGNAHLFRCAFGSNDEKPVAGEWDGNGDSGDCVCRLNRHVLECPDRGVTPMNTVADYLANLRIVEAVYRSAAEGRRVEL